MALVMGRSRIRMEIHRQGKYPKPDFKEAIARSNFQSAQYAESDAHRRMIPHNVTGETDRGIGSDVDGWRGFNLYGSNDEIWWLEFGTQAHLITPTLDHVLTAESAGHLAWLHWIDPSAGPIYAIIVEHPGQEATPILRPSIRSNEGIFQEFIGDAIADEWDHG